MINYSTQTIDQSDLKSVEEVLTSPYLTTGPTVTAFEDAICEYVGCNYAIAVNSCTSALHLALLALGIKPLDLVYVSAISFVASANCARYCGADVEFCEVDAHSGNLDLDALEKQLQEAEQQHRLPKALVGVHLSGRPLELARLYELKERYHFYLIEDAAHALGAQYHGQMIGCSKVAEVTVLSFHPVKIITTAEGGMCLTNQPELAHTIRALSSHGITHAAEELRDKSLPPYYYEMQSLGYNYRLSDLQAALGLSQLERIDEFLEKRRQQALAYQEILADSELGLPRADTPENLSSWHLYQVLIPQGRRDFIYTKMREKGYGVQVHYLPIYRHPYYQKLKRYPPLPGAESFFASTLSIPLFPKLDKLTQQMCAIALLTLLDQGD
ncbi:MAG: UDP-4-amino-4,6-dideoxy-N-acetyl-beta-L-altrosamine transaminase [Succinivibrio sp.]|nr:UDP-4-amino-4,6-dideoxy-N-acetyl-beta-L-altrosamine transaminase [Succinivibrio sp.]